MNRRQMLKATGAPLAATCLLGCNDVLNLRSKQEKMAREGLTLADADADKKFLIVLTASGGASLIDGCMALSSTEVNAAGGNAATLNCFEEAQLTAIAGSPFKAPKVDTTIGALGGYAISTDQAPFMQKHYRDMMAVTIEGTSVNHGIAQRRSVTGNDAWNGRTLQEAVAAQYGANLPIANLNLGSGGFALPGIDESLPDFAKLVNATNAAYWPLGLSSHLGLPVSVDAKKLDLMRRFRERSVESKSNFWTTFKDDALIRRWMSQRERGRDDFEQSELIRKLYWYPKSSGDLEPNPEAASLRELFPNYDRDSFDAQAILAYLAITQNVSCSVTLDPNTAAEISETGLSEFYNPPIAYDFSHTDHRGTQAMMWERMLTVADKLIDLLKAKEYTNGQSYWDRTMIYVATDFGRSRQRPSGSESFSTGHDLNNGFLVLSPMANGNSILGGVNPATGLTYGFDPTTGAPEPGRKMTEKEIYSGLLQVMDVDTAGSGLPNMRAMKKV